MVISFDPQTPQSYLPSFLEPLPSDLDAFDLEYLRIKGALMLPSLKLRIAIIHSFVRHVFAHLPFIDVHRLVQAVNGKYEHCNQISLLLFQAIMLAGSTFVDLEDLEGEGFESRLEAQRIYYQKAKRLYDLDYDPNVLTRLQAALLFTYHPQTAGHHQDPEYWMTTALSLAFTLGLNCSNLNSPEAHDHKLRRRIWWSCVIRERLMRLGTRKHTSILIEEYDVPVLNRDDFEFKRMHLWQSETCNKKKILLTLEAQERLAVINIYMAQLCELAGLILRGPLSFLTRTSTTSSRILRVKPTDITEMVQMVDQKLMDWAEALPECCQFQPYTAKDTLGDVSSIAVQRTFLHMAYYTISLMLHRVQFLPYKPWGFSPASPELQGTSRVRAREAVMCITQITDGLNQSGQVRFLPAGAVAMISSAIIMHVLNAKSSCTISGKVSSSGFLTCIHAMEALTDVYPETAQTINQLHYIISTGFLTTSDACLGR